MSETIKEEIQNTYESQMALFTGREIGHEQLSVHRVMTDSELIEARLKYIDLNSQITDLQNELDIVKKQYQGQLKPLVAEAETVLSSIRMKAIDVKEDCVVLADDKNSKVRYYSAITGEMVKVRDMTDQDRQLLLDMKQEEAL